MSLGEKYDELFEQIYLVLREKKSLLYAPNQFSLVLLRTVAEPSLQPCVVKLKLCSQIDLFLQNFNNFLHDRCRIGLVWNEYKTYNKLIMVVHAVHPSGVYQQGLVHP
jgi:hypothetical protein